MPWHAAHSPPAPVRQPPRRKTGLEKGPPITGTGLHQDRSGNCWMGGNRRPAALREWARLSAAELHRKPAPTGIFMNIRASQPVLKTDRSVTQCAPSRARDSATDSAAESRYLARSQTAATAIAAIMPPTQMQAHPCAKRQYLLALVGDPRTQPLIQRTGVRNHGIRANAAVAQAHQNQPFHAACGRTKNMSQPQ